MIPAIISADVIQLAGEREMSIYFIERSPVDNVKLISITQIQSKSIEPIRICTANMHVVLSLIHDVTDNFAI